MLQKTLIFKKKNEIQFMNDSVEIDAKHEYVLKKIRYNLLKAIPVHNFSMS